MYLPLYIFTIWFRYIYMHAYAYAYAQIYACIGSTYIRIQIFGRVRF